VVSSVLVGAPVNEPKTASRWSSVMAIASLS